MIKNVGRRKCIMTSGRKKTRKK